MTMNRLKGAAAACILLALAACATNPLSTAQTVEQKADAIYAQYVIAKEQAATVISDPTVSDAVKVPIAQAAVASKPAADSLESALETYAQAESALAAGTTTSDKLTIAATNLQQWVDTATPLINTLVTQIGKTSK